MVGEEVRQEARPDREVGAEGGELGAEGHQGEQDGELEGEGGQGGEEGGQAVRGAAAVLRV